MEPFIPENLPLPSLDWAKFVPQIGLASIELGNYNGILQNMVNPKILLSPLTTREAVLSSKIEGTQATVKEVYQFEAGSAQQPESAKKVEDIREVLNYRNAVVYAVSYLETRPLTLNLLKEIHSILLDNVRGRNKARGEFRTEQNHIGKPGSSIAEASYIPPKPELVMGALYNLETYIHSEEQDRLVQLSIVHAQFEIIHPFLDGNGRVGRMLVPLFLMEKGMLSMPAFYISEFLDSNCDEYYARLNRITAAGDWDGWVNFFLKAIIEQAKNNSSKAKAVLKLYNDTKEQITSIHSQWAIQILDALFQIPSFKTSVFAERSGLSPQNASRILRAMSQRGIIREVVKGSGRRQSSFDFDGLLELVK
jgi:Fic family protein